MRDSPLAFVAAAAASAMSLISDTLPAMIEIRQINDPYSIGREKVGGKLYVIATTGAHVASFSGLTKTLEWYQSVGPEEKAVIEAYQKDND